MQRKRRLVLVALLTLVTAGGTLFGTLQQGEDPPPSSLEATTVRADSALATSILDTLPVKGRAAKTGYSRAQFGNGWNDLGNCDVRNYILARDLDDEKFVGPDDCRVQEGTLHDPYTNQIISFLRGPGSSAKVQIDHVVALSDAWQKGAQQLLFAERQQLANDPINLLAVDGKTNNNKSDSDAASWLPPHKPYRCPYVARQIAVKQKYHLWVTAAERDAMRRILRTCPQQQLPLVVQSPS